MAAKKGIPAQKLIRWLAVSETPHQLLGATETKHA